LALIPHLFAQITQDTSADFIIIPSVSSERREYIPMSFLGKENISTNLCLIISRAEPYIFGILQSKMHMVWVSAVSGKLETRIRYSKNISYNTFPFPSIKTKDRERINLHVFSVLEEREKHPEKTMGQLYDPDKMPEGLRQAHKELDEAIERCYRLKPFENDTERLEYLFKEYEKMINKNTLLEKGRKKTTKKRK